MAVINHEEVARQQRMNEAYSELLNFLETKKGQKYLNRIDLEDYLREKHEELRIANEKIKKYQEFFKTLSNFLPQKSSITNRLY